MLQIAQQAPSLWRETTLYNLRRRRFFDTCALFGSGQSAMALIATQWTWIRTQADTFTINYSVHLPLIPTYHIQEDAGGRTPDLWERQWMAERLAPKREMLSETVWMVPERLWQRGLRPDCTPELYPPHPLVYRFDLGPRILLEKNRPFQKEDFHANGEVTLRYRGTLPVALGLVWKLGYSDVILCGIDLEGPYFYQDDPTWAGYFERLDREYPLRVQSWPLYPHEIGVGGTPRPMSEYLVAANEFVFKPANRRLWRGGSSRAQLPKWQWE